MRKKYITRIIITIIFVVIVTITIIFYNNERNNHNLDTQVKTKLTTTEVENLNQEYNLQMISTIASEEKVSPMAILIFKTKYNDCNHIAIDRLEIPKELVNNTEDEIKEKYKDWKIEQFSSNEIIFYQEKDGMCKEHYVLRDKDGYLAIYTVDSYGNETLKEMTQIVTTYLPETDVMRLKNGIEVVGKEKLNATLEDYE